MRSSPMKTPANGPCISRLSRVARLAIHHKPTPAVGDVNCTPCRDLGLKGAR